MKNTLLLISLCGLLSACGGGSNSSSDSEETPVEQVGETFKLTLTQIDDCNNMVPYSGRDVLIYDQSLSANPSSNYSIETTDAQGSITLNNVVNPVSFTLNNPTDNGDRLLYTFIDIEPGDHSINVGFKSNENTAECSCADYSVRPTIYTGHSMQDVVEVNFNWGAGISGYTIDNDIYQVTMCNDPSQQISVWMRTNVDEYLYGHLSMPDTSAGIIELEVNRVADKMPLPDHAVYASVYTSNIIDGNDHLSESTNNYRANEFPVFSEVNESFIRYSGTADITTSYTGAAFEGREAFSYSSNKTHQIDASIPTDFSALNTASIMELNALDNKNFSITDDLVEAVTHTEISAVFKEAGGEEIRWYTYAPATRTMTLPNIQAEWESRIQSADLDFLSFELVRVMNASDSNESIIMRRFGNVNSLMDFQPYQEMSTSVSAGVINAKAKKTTLQRLEQNYRDLRK